MGTIFHAGDLHVGAPVRANAPVPERIARDLKQATTLTLQRIVALADEHDATALALGGDLFDHATRDSPAVRARLASILGGRSGPTAVLLGTHDPAADALGLPDGAVALTRDAPTLDLGEFALHGIDADGIPDPTQRLAAYPAPGDGRLDVGLLHAGPAQSTSTAPTPPLAADALAQRGYHAWIVTGARAPGPSDGPPTIVRAGAAQPRHPAEAGQGDATLLTITDDGVHQTLVPVAAVRIERLLVSLDDVGSWDEVQDATTRALDALEHADGLRGCIAIIQLTGATTLHRRLREIDGGDASAWSDRLGLADRLDAEPWTLVDHVLVETHAPGQAAHVDGARSGTLEHTLLALADDGRTRVQLAEAILGAWPTGLAAPTSDALARRLDDAWVRIVARARDALEGSA